MFTLYARPGLIPAKTLGRLRLFTETNLLVRIGVLAELMPLKSPITPMTKGSESLSLAQRGLVFSVESSAGLSIGFPTRYTVRT